MRERDYLINKKVYERYPKTEKEKTCRIEKNRLDNLRELLRRRLESESERSDIQEYTSK